MSEPFGDGRRPKPPFPAAILPGRLPNAVLLCGRSAAQLAPNSCYIAPSELQGVLHDRQEALVLSHSPLTCNPPPPRIWLSACRQPSPCKQPQLAQWLAAPVAGQQQLCWLGGPPAPLGGGGSSSGLASAAAERCWAAGEPQRRQTAAQVGPAGIQNPGTCGLGKSGRPWQSAGCGLPPSPAGHCSAACPLAAAGTPATAEGSAPLLAVEGDIVTLNWKCFNEEGEVGGWVLLPGAAAECSAVQCSAVQCSKKVGAGQVHQG